MKGPEWTPFDQVLHSFLDSCNVSDALQKRVMRDLNHQYVHPIALIRRSIIELVRSPRLSHLYDFSERDTEIKTKRSR